MNGKRFSIYQQTESVIPKTDEQLWAAVALNDCTKSFSTLFDRYWSLIYKTAFNYTKDIQTSEEITHDIFVNLWKKKSKLQINTFSAYLRMAARYHVYRTLKTNRNKQLLFIDEWDKITEQTSIDTADANINYHDTLQQIHRALSELPARCQEIFRMSRFEHLSNDEIAQKLGISKRTVENQITSASHYLRKTIKPHVFVLIFIFLSL